MQNIIDVRFLHAYKTESEWVSLNPIGGKGELMISSDKYGMFKIGNGTDKWNDLQYNHVTWGNISGKPSTFTPSSHTHTKSQITDFPSSLPASDVYSWAKASSKPSYSWSEITGKPSTFTPSSHNHSSITRAEHLDTVDKLNAFIEANIFKYATIGELDGLDGLAKNDGIIFSASWKDSTTYGHQIYIDDSGYTIAHRYRNQGSWSAWKTLIDSNNYTSYTVTKSGSGASGTWGINVTGSAGSVAWGNVSGRPSSLPASDVYAWAKASSKPSYSWGEITGKPSSFTPSSHTHNYLPLSGGTVTGSFVATSITSGDFICNGDFTQNGTATFKGNTTMVGLNAELFSTSAVEISNAKPYIDFHFNSSTGDYTSRIIELESGKLNVNGVVCNSGAIWGTNIAIDGPGTFTRGITSKAESIFHTGSYTDPYPGKVCTIKSWGTVASLRFAAKGISNTWLGAAKPDGAAYDTINTDAGALVPGWRVRTADGAWVGASYAQDPGFRIYYCNASRLAGSSNGTDAVFTFGKSGIMYASSFSQTSDERRKNVITNLSTLPQAHKDFFMKLNPFTFKWKKEEDKQSHYGVGAQSVYQAALDCGFTDDDLGFIHKGKELPGTSIPWSVSYTEFIPLNIAVTQDHETRIEKLEAHASKLERENEELKQQIKELKGLTA